MTTGHDYKPTYPNDFIHSLLSAHAYQDSSEGDNVFFPDNHRNAKYNEYLADWKIHKVFNKPESGDYYSAIYVNENTKQMVLSHRGTDFSKGWSKDDGPLKTDLVGVLGGKIVAQQICAYEATESAANIAKAKNNEYNLSVTGHSLGAWLAELSFYYLYKDFNLRDKSKAVTFDSPGSVMHMKKHEGKEQLPPKDVCTNKLGIVTYLSAPNFVNSCNQHPGKIYRLFPNIEEPGFVKQMKDNYSQFGELFGKKVTKDPSALDGIWSVFGHSLGPLIDTFDPETGLPKECKEMLDWPVITYTPSGENDHSNMVTKIFDKLNPVSKVKKSLHEKSLITVLHLFKEVANGNLGQEQYLEYFKHIDENKSSGGYDVKHNLSSTDNFSLTYASHYRYQDVDRYQDVLYSANIGGSDWLLQAWENCPSSDLPKEINSDIRTRLANLQDKYKIGDKDAEAILIVTDQKININILRDLILQIKKEYPDINNFFHNRKPSINTKKEINNYIPTEKDSSFTGRKDILDKLKNRAKELFKNKKTSDQYTVITGAPGVGKSSIVTKYAHSQDTKGMMVRYFQSDVSSNIDTEYRKLAETLGINTENVNKEEIIRIVNDKLHTESGIFIFDNVNKYEDVKDYFVNFPKSIQVIITTRDAKILSNKKLKYKHIKVKPFTKDEALRYLQKTLKKYIKAQQVSDEDLIKLIEAIGNGSHYMPYRLDKAVAYLKAKQIKTIPEYIEEYLQIYADGKEDKAETELLLNIVTETPKAWQIMQYASYLNPDFISFKLIKELLVIDDDELEQCINKLESLSLIKVEKQQLGNGLSLHRLTQSGIQDYIKRHPKEIDSTLTEEEIRNELVSTLAKLMPYVDDNPDQKWSESHIYYPHVIRLLEKYSETLSKTLTLAELERKIAFYYQKILTNFEQAKKNYTDALNIKEKIYKDNLNHQDIAKSYNDLGRINSIMVEHDQAIEYYKKALKIYEDQLNNRDIAMVLNNLGDCYRSKGKYDQAITKHQKALNIRLEIYNDQPNHPDIAMSYHNLGLTYYSKGNDDKAITNYNDALSINKKISNNLSCARNYNGLGNVYYNRKDYTKAKENYNNTFEVYKTVYKGHLNHFNFAMVYNNLARSEAADGKHDQAIEYFDKALKIYEKHLPLNHSDTAMVLNNLGDCYRSKGEYDQAITKHQKALNIRLEIYNDQPNHPDIAMSYHNLGDVKSAQKEYDQAIEYYKKALKIYEVAYKDNLDHPYIKECRENLEIAQNNLQATQDTNPTGNGAEDHAETSFWYEYSKAAMKQLLELRLISADMESKVDVIHPSYVFSEATKLAFTQDLVSQIASITNSTTGGKILIPININNQHWVGMSMEFTADDKILINYMDSEGEVIPASLRINIEQQLSETFPSASIEISEKEVEQQKYNNCGLEVIENLIAAVAGEAARLSQEDALAVHSALHENNLAAEFISKETKSEQKTMKIAWKEARDEQILERVEEILLEETNNSYISTASKSQYPAPVLSSTETVRNLLETLIRFISGEPLPGGKSITDGITTMQSVPDITVPTPIITETNLVFDDLT